jgi:hypothetical protein
MVTVSMEQGETGCWWDRVCSGYQGKGVGSRHGDHPSGRLMGESRDSAGEVMGDLVRPTSGGAVHHWMHSWDDIVWKAVGCSGYAQDHWR